jgi:hypothetical protein
MKPMAKREPYAGPVLRWLTRATEDERPAARQGRSRFEPITGAALLIVESNGGRKSERFEPSPLLC